MTRDWQPDMADAAVSMIATTPRLLVALDFDGTASELVAEPMTARAIPEVKQAIQQLVRLPDTTVAFVSGRSLVHLREIAEHGDESKVVLAGSHGAQYWYPGDGEADAGEGDDDGVLRDELLDELAGIMSEHPGIELERKTFGIGVHGRRATPEVETAAFAAADDVLRRRAPQWRRRTGDRILEFSSRDEGKDTAIRVLREHTGATGILFAGDDVTDEDALAVLGPDDLGVRVGAGETAATLRVDSPQQIGRLLAVIASERGTRPE